MRRIAIVSIATVWVVWNVSAEDSLEKKAAPAHKIVTYQARFDIDRLSGGKRFQGSILYLDNGKQLVTSYRPIQKYFEFVDKRVIVEGFHYTYPPDVQQIMADHFQITSMRLAPGERPYPQKPTELPTPPAVQKKADFETRAGRWVQLIAILKEGQKHEDDDWCDVVLQLDDHTRIKASMYITTFNDVWNPLIGKRVTSIGRARIVEKARNRFYELIGPISICAGEVARCGMSQTVYERDRKTLTKSGELLKDYKGKVQLPQDLYQTYADLVQAIAKADPEEIQQHCLPQSVSFSRDARPEQTRDYGQDINLQFLQDGFHKYILNLRKDSSDTYLIRTGSSYLYFVKTKNLGWKLYRYGDKPIE